MAQCGVASRRKCEALILQGKVRVNGTTISQLGTLIDPEKDDISVAGHTLSPPDTKQYIILNKPKGIIVTRHDTHGRKTVMDLLGDKALPGVFPVGRLDKDSEGLLLLTNDGELAHRLIHPRYEIEKEYIAKVKGTVPPETIRNLGAGVRLEDGVTLPSQVSRVRREKDTTTFHIVIREGKKREIRRMCEHVGHPVLKLTRIRIGPLKLGQVKKGMSRILSKRELAQLQSAVSL